MPVQKRVIQREDMGEHLTKLWKSYLRVLSKRSYEGIDFWDFVYGFWQTRERAE